MKAHIARVDSLFQQLENLPQISDDNKKRLERKFRLEFNYNSNHMEGNTLTYSETELLLYFEDTKGSHTMREFDEMRAHDVAFNFIKELATSDRPLTEQIIKQLNEIILVKPFWKDAITPNGQPTRRLIKVGDYKEYPNSVRLQNGEIFEYASPSDTPILMGDLVSWFRKEEKEIHPCILATMLHYKFVRIHPFDDGNGRVARLLMNYVLIKSGYPPIVVKSSDKTNYLRALNAADAGEDQTLIEYMAEQLVWSLEVSIKATKGESIDEPGDLDKKIKELNRRLRIQEGKQVTVRKDSASLEGILLNVFMPLAKKFEERLSDLEIHFKERKISILANDAPATILKIRSRIKEAPSEVHSLTFLLSFMGFRSGKKPLDAHSSFRIVFFGNVYEIQDGKITRYSKLYDEILTDEEQAEIVEYVGAKMVEQIEASIEKS
jgi:Fic family protein